MIPSTLGIARPELLGLLLLAPLLGALIVLAAVGRKRALRTFAGTTALSARSGARMWLKSALLFIAFLAVVIALAGPYVDLRVRGARRLGVDIVLAVDVSQSMATKDVTPDRLRAARHFAEELGTRMTGSRVSLVLFAGQGTTRYPATTDPRILGEVLDNSGKGTKLQQGSSLAAAVAASLAAFSTDDPKRGRAIVILSDGEVTVGGTPDGAAAADKSVKLYTIGIGTPNGAQIPTYDARTGDFTGYLRGPDGTAIVSKLGESALQGLAAAGGGQYWRYTGDDGVIGELASQLRTLEAVEPVDEAGSVPDERSGIFVAIAVACVLLERLISDRRGMPAPRESARAARRGRRVLGIAIGSTLLWAVACGESLKSIDDANGLFAAGRYQEALAAYRDLQQKHPDAPELSINAGNALHMITDYARALPDYAHATIDTSPVDMRAIAQYDRGNTLFRLGRLEEARDAYRESLRLDPSDRDAKFNLEVVQRQLDAKQGQQGQPGQSGKPGSSGQPGGQGSSGSQQPGASASPDSGQGQGQQTDQQQDPKNDQTGTPTTASDLRNALSNFRQGFTIDDALLVLDALQGQQRGIAQLIEGPRDTRGPNPEY